MRQLIAAEVETEERRIIYSLFCRVASTVVAPLPSTSSVSSRPASQILFLLSLSLSFSLSLSLSLSLSKHALGKDLLLRLSIAALNLGLAFSTNLLHLLTSLSFFALQETAELLASCVAVCAPSCGRGHIQCHDHDYGRVSFRSHHLQPDFR